jgi:hypothetical protein
MFVFDTTNRKSPRFEVFPCIEKQLETFQSHVKGNISILPHKDGFNAPFVAYASDTGLIDGHASNFLSHGTLVHLGFMSELGLHFGNVVLTGQTNGEARALTKTEKKQVLMSVKKYHREMDNM